MEIEQPISVKTYTVLSGGENTFDISRRLKITTAELMEHNGLTSYYVDAGVVLHLPYPAEKIEEPIPEKYAYTMYESPELFHVSKQQGAKKYAYGNAKTYKDIFPVSYTYKYCKEISVTGEVVITFSPDRVYSYYIDAMDAPNGKLKNSIGFPKEYLQEGAAPKPVIANPTIREVADTLAAIGEALPDEPNEQNFALTNWKETYADLPDGPILMKTRFACSVIDYDGKRPTKGHYYGNIRISGTFLVPATEDGVTKFIEYGRPEASVKNNSWYGINWSNLEEAERLRIEDKAGQLYEVTPPDAKRLKIYESALFPVIGKSVASGVKAVDYAKNKVKRKFI